MLTLEETRSLVGDEADRLAIANYVPLGAAPGGLPDLVRCFELAFTEDMGEFVPRPISVPAEQRRDGVAIEAIGTWVARPGYPVFRVVICPVSILDAIVAATVGRDDTEGRPRVLMLTRLQLGTVGYYAATVDRAALALAWPEIAFYRAQGHRAKQAPE